MSLNALLVNDTRSEQHAGCQYVVENIIREADKAEIIIRETISVSSKNYLEQCKEKIKSCDFLLINGEGSLHHNKDRAKGILETAKYSNSYGIKSVLINTVWQSNSELLAYLKHFDFISCRESLSANEIINSGYSAIVTPDMTFASSFEHGSAPEDSDRLLVLDSVRSKLSSDLFKFALSSNYNFLPLSHKGLEKMKKHLFRMIHYKIKKLQVVKDPVKEAVDILNNHEFILSARFHGTCLGMILNKKVISIASNTHKLEGLYKDIGLSQDLVLSQEKWREANFKKLAVLATSEQYKVEKYVSEAKKSIPEMFVNIKNVVDYA